MSERGRPWEQVGPGTPGGRLLRRWWQPVYRVADLVPGRPARLRVLGEELVIWRGASGRIGLAGARCPHRNTALWLGEVEGDALRCMHHGWCFDPEGRCTDRPGEIAAGAAGLRRYPALEALGLIFAWMGSGPPPPPPRFPDWEAPGVLRVLAPELWPCGFFQRLENSLDFAHLPYAHALSGVGRLARDLPPPRARRSELGVVVDAPGLPEVHCLLPNALIFPTPISEAVGWRQHLVWRVPVGDRSCVSFSVALIPAAVPGAEGYRVGGPLSQPLAPSRAARLGAEVIAGRRRLSELAGEAVLTEVEDYVALVGQGDPGGWEPEILGRMDGPLRLLRQRWREAAAAGGGAMPWRAPTLPGGGAWRPGGSVPEQSP